MSYDKPLNPADVSNAYTRVLHGWVNVRAKPGPGFEARALALHERLDSSWFDSKWRERLDDGCRMAGKNARTWRGIRLYARWWFGVARKPLGEPMARAV